MSLAEVKPPTSGNVRRSAIAATASAVVTIDQRKCGYYTFISNVDVYLLFGGSGVPAPDPNETVDTELDVPMLIKANTPTHYRITKACRYFRHIGSTGILRFYKSGE